LLFYGDIIRHLPCRGCHIGSSRQEPLTSSG
jgi:hypothetical protein